MTTDQPTPPSSLEEAREQAINAALLPFTPAGEPLHTYVTERVDNLIVVARAEVIREVEALDEKAWLAQRGMFGDLSEHDTDAAVTDLIDAVLTFTVRALSLGGEGEA